MRSLLVVVLALAGCSTQNPNYCPGGGSNGENNCKLIDAGPDGPTACNGNNDCSGTQKVCKAPPNGICVECLERSDCGGTKPTCDTAMNMCVACGSHAECPASGACLPDGSCADPLQVAYASQTGGGTACTAATPCKTLNEALATMKPVVKLLGPGTIEGMGDTTIDRKVTIVAEAGTVLDRTDNGPILTIADDGEVAIADLQIAGAGGVMGDGIQVQAGGDLTLERVVVHTNGNIGVVATSAKVVIRRSVFSTNAGGGAQLNVTDFEITNSIFVANGAVASSVGGLQLQARTAAYLFSFNTVANNVAGPAQPSKGIACVTLMNLSNSIINSNTTTPLNCMFDHSLFDPGSTVTGDNVAGAPAFRNIEMTMPTSPTYYRIGATSDAKNRADTAAPIAIDIDGEKRPQGNAKDIGADEAPP